MSDDEHPASRGATLGLIDSLGTKDVSEMPTSKLREEYTAAFPPTKEEFGRLAAIENELDSRGVDVEALP